MVGEVARDLLKMMDVIVPLSKYDATSAPTADDDSANTSGNGVFGVGSAWVNLTTDTIYLCTDASEGAAVWNSISAGAAVLDVAQEWTKAQNFDATTLTDAASIAWNVEDNQVASVTLGGNRTLANPTNMKDGATYILRVIQDGTGSRTLAYGAAYKWPGGAAPTLTTTATAVDILTFVSDGTNMYGVAQLAFA